uniref:Gustatory receptor n=1 Tax=Schizaphis graminum TaxID=13262 RepID=A0A2S2NCB2_SCHGA
MDKEISEVTSLVMIICVELVMIGKFVSLIWRVFFDEKLSIILTKLEKIHEKLIRLNMVGAMKINMNWFFIFTITAQVIENIVFSLLWFEMSKTKIRTIDMVSATVMNVVQCGSFFEYILLILYIQRMLYTINENILERKSCLSSFRDMHLEVLECLNHVNRSIYGLPVVVVFILGFVAEIINTIYSHMLFPRDYVINDFYYFLCVTIRLLIKIVNVLMLYRIGHFMEQEVIRTSFVLQQRSLIERNPRVKRQIKFFILRRLHEYYRFELYGICQINLRQLLILVNKTFAYLIIQILFKLNK